MTMNRSAAAATIFSRKWAPPPPLISQPSGGDLVGPVDRDVESVDSLERPDVDAELPGVPLGRGRGGDAVDRELARGESREQEGDRGAGSEAHLRPVLDELGGRCLGRGSLLGVGRQTRPARKGNLSDSPGRVRTCYEAV